MNLHDFIGLMGQRLPREEVRRAFQDLKAQQESERRALFRPFGAPDGLKNPASWVYHQHSKLTHGWSAALTPEAERALTLDRAYRRYPQAQRVALPPGELDPARSLLGALTSRRSRRTFGAAPVGRGAFATLLAQGCGVTGVDEVPRRASPSAGALYPVETYALVLSVAGLDPAVYHYLPLEHALETLRPALALGDFDACNPDLLRRCRPGAVLVLTANLERTQAKYRERGYRFALLEAGHVAQNLLLLATALGLDAVPMGGFLDDELNAFLGLDTTREVAVYAVLVGTPASQPNQRGADHA
jgi:SagB-type dehydrogenase family enzyme